MKVIEETWDFKYWKEKRDPSVMFPRSIVPLQGCCETNAVFKNQRNLFNIFYIKDCLPYYVVS